jgi:formylglycine-generating enzyme required for sulfatase activity
VDIKVECFNDGKPLRVENIDKAITGKTYSLSKADEGIGFFYIDPVKAFGKSQVSLANFTVKLTLTESNALDSEPIYKIIDLETKEVTDLSRADFYNDRGRKYGTYETSFAAIGSSPSKGTPYTTSLENVFIWTGVTNDIAYKTTKLVMRRITAKNKTFTMGGANDYQNTPSDDYLLTVSLTNDYWLAVFETTCKQAQLLQGYVDDAASLTDEKAAMPATRIAKIDSTVGTSYKNIRGNPSKWEGWPENVYAVASDSALGRIRGVFPGFSFDVPTEAQWEYACRAGTETMYYSGINPDNSEANYIAEVSELAWNSANSEGVSHAVGLLKPNAFGLYDMLGNVGELTRDLHDPSTPVNNSENSVSGPAYPTVSEEPSGWMDKDAVLKADENCWTLFRGEHFARDYKRVKSACRRGFYQKVDGRYGTWFGVRLFLPMEQN